MAATTYSGTHTIVGKTNSGHKIVFSDILAKDTNTGTVSPTVIPPLVKVHSWAVGIKHPGSTPRTYKVTLGSDTSYLSGSNVFYIENSGNGTSGRLCIMSVGD